MTGRLLEFESALVKRKARVDVSAPDVSNCGIVQHEAVGGEIAARDDRRHDLPVGGKRLVETIISK